MKNFKILFVLICLLISNSCHKEQPDNYNPYSIAENPVEPLLDPIPTEIGFTDPFHQEINETLLSFIHLMSTITHGAYEYYNFTGQAETRVGCPEFTASGVPGTFILDFNDGGGTCTQGGIEYDGSASITFAGLLFINHSGADIRVNSLTGLTINDYTFELTGTLDLEFLGVAQQAPYINPAAGINAPFYSMSLSSGGSITSTKTESGITTTTTLNDVDNIAIGVTNLGAPNNNLGAWVDNELYYLLIDDTPVTCSNGSTTSNFCVNNASLSETIGSLLLNPLAGSAFGFACGCPIAGILRINNSADCSTSPTGRNATVYDFQFIDEVTLSTAGCENQAMKMSQFIEYVEYEGLGFIETHNSTEVLGVMVNEKIGVEEDGTDAAGLSLQLKDTGTGFSAHGFQWAGPSTHSRGLINDGQTIANTTSTTLPWINEIHYDNSDPDTNEGFEIAGPAGFDLSGYRIRRFGTGVGYDQTFDLPLSGTIPNEGGSGYGAIWFPFSGLSDDGSAYAFIKTELFDLSYCN